MALTKIEWADCVWNVITGCTPVSEGCQNCYARRMAYRLRGRCGYPEDEPFQVTLHEDKLQEPLKWKKSRKVFVGSMGDLFHPDVPDEFIYHLFLTMALSSNHTYIILTKRPEKAREWYAKHPNGPAIGYNSFLQPIYGEWPLHNVWVGVTAENQQRADERIPILLQIPAKVRFVSVEPMLGPVHFKRDWLICPGAAEYGHGLSLTRVHADGCCEQHVKIDWVIAGGETGPGARPMHPDWVRGLRDQCQEAGVPFFFKSWGDYKPLPYSDRGDGLHALTEYKGCKYDFVKVGKKAAGRLLDGRTWDEMPIVEGGSNDDCLVVAFNSSIGW